MERRLSRRMRQKCLAYGWGLFKGRLHSSRRLKINCKEPPAGYKSLPWIQNG
jgi:hypothetical protein